MGRTWSQQHEMANDIKTWHELVGGKRGGGACATLGNKR